MTTTYPYYAIVIIGSGKIHRYALKKIVNRNLLLPADNQIHKTEESAWAAARQLGLTVSAIGSIYEVL